MNNIKKKDIPVDQADQTESSEQLSEEKIAKAEFEKAKQYVFRRHKNLLKKLSKS